MPPTDHRMGVETGEDAPVIFIYDVSVNQTKTNNKLAKYFGALLVCSLLFIHIQMYYFHHKAWQRDIIM